MDLGLFTQLLVDGIVLGSTYALLGLSFGIIYSTTGIFHFAHAVVYALAAYGAVVGADVLGLPWPLALGVGIATAIAVGIAIEVAAYRPLREAGGTQMAVFLVSLGLTILTPALLQIVFGPENQTFEAFSPQTYSVRGTTFTSLDVAIVATSAALVAAVLLFLKRTRYGLATTAARVNREMAAAVGIPLDRIHMLVFGLGSALVAVAALLFLVNGVARPDMGLTPVLFALIAVFLGGVGSMLGAAIGGMLVGLVTSLSALWLSADYQIAVVFALLFVIIIARPQGLLGKVAA